MSEISIDKNIPIPKRPGGRPTMYPWREMEVGDSFLLPNTKAAKGVASVGKRMGRKFATRTTPEGVRVWRVA